MNNDPAHAAVRSGVPNPGWCSAAFALNLNGNLTVDADALLRQYVWGGYIDELLQQREDLGQSTENLYPLQDLLYRTTALTDDTGSIIEAYDTDAYGNTLIFNAPGAGADWWANDAQQTYVPTCAFIFTGRRYDPETELYQYRNRYYAPQWGRFVSRDPFDYDDALGLHQYVGSQPMSNADAFGLKRWGPMPINIGAPGGAGGGRGGAGAAPISPPRSHPRPQRMPDRQTQPTRRELIGGAAIGAALTLKYTDTCLRGTHIEVEGQRVCCPSGGS